jgi:hypothetical protein
MTSGLFAKPRTIVGCTRLSCLKSWIRHAGSEWGALTGCWFSWSFAPTPLDTVPMASWSEEKLETVQMTWQLSVRCLQVQVIHFLGIDRVLWSGRETPVASPG